MTVEEKRQLELKTMRQIIGIYCHDNIIRRRENCVRIVNRYGSMHNIVLLSVHIWNIKHFVAYAKLIVMRQRTEIKFVKLCAMVVLECCLYLQFKLFVICI